MFNDPGFAWAINDARRHVEDFANWELHRRQNYGLTWALLNGASAGEIASCKSSANPYSTGSLWRWAWMTGFDLGRRISEAYIDGYEAALQPASQTNKE